MIGNTNGITNGITKPDKKNVELTHIIHVFVLS